MLLTDSSVWVDHLRKNDPRLQQALLDDQILMHPFVLGELGCGSLHRRASILSDLGQLPLAISAKHEEVLELLERHRLYAKGIGWVDAHLLASAALTRCRLWTHDARLADAATSLKLGLKPGPNN